MAPKTYVYARAAAAVLVFVCFAGCPAGTGIEGYWLIEMVPECDGEITGIYYFSLYSDGLAVMLPVNFVGEWSLENGTITITVIDEVYDVEYGFTGPVAGGVIEGEITVGGGAGCFTARKFEFLE